MIPGFEEGLKGMREGRRRRVVVPPELGPRRVRRRSSRRSSGRCSTSSSSRSRAARGCRAASCPPPSCASDSSARAGFCRLASTDERQMHTRPSRLYITSRRDPNRPIAVHLFSPRTRLSPHLRFVDFPAVPRVGRIRSRSPPPPRLRTRPRDRLVRVVFAVSVRVRVIERVVSADSVLQLIQALHTESRLSKPILEIPFPVFEAEPEVLELEIRVEVCVRGSPRTST